MTKGKTIGGGLVVATVISLLIPIAVSMASADPSSGGNPEFATGGPSPPPQPPQPPPPGCGSRTPADAASPPSGLTSDLCCPDDTPGHWQWGGYSGQNLYYCDAPPVEPPATAESPAVSPATSAPKKAAAAAKPIFTG